jgi:pSer/pThr/pTyr-binding forkhead associated (FHA) protein
MSAKLIEPGKRPGEKREIPISKDEFLIGRGADCDLRLRSSSISRHHCLLRLRGGTAVILDLGSSNGTFVNDHRVRSQAELHSGDEIRVGTYHFVLALGPGEGISWCVEEAADQASATCKLSELPKLPLPRDEPPASGGAAEGDKVTR